MEKGADLAGKRLSEERADHPISRDLTSLERRCNYVNSSQILQSSL